MVFFTEVSPFSDVLHFEPFAWTRYKPLQVCQLHYFTGNAKSSYPLKVWFLVQENQSAKNQKMIARSSGGHYSVRLGEVEGVHGRTNQTFCLLVKPVNTWGCLFVQGETLNMNHRPAVSRNMLQRLTNVLSASEEWSKNVFFTETSLRGSYMLFFNGKNDI